jgi:hypothetical protein
MRCELDLAAATIAAAKPIDGHELWDEFIDKPQAEHVHHRIPTSANQSIWRRGKSARELVRRFARASVTTAGLDATAVLDRAARVEIDEKCSEFAENLFGSKP